MVLCGCSRVVWFWGFRFVTCLLLCLDVGWFVCGFRGELFGGGVCLIYVCSYFVCWHVVWCFGCFRVFRLRCFCWLLIVLLMIVLL